MLFTQHNVNWKWLNYLRWTHGDCEVINLIQEKMAHHLEYKKYMRDEKVNKINDLFVILTSWENQELEKGKGPWAFVIV